VSLKAEHTDVAVAALERVGDTEGLAAIAQRGRNKVAARRARYACGRSRDAVTPVPKPRLRRCLPRIALAPDSCSGGRSAPSRWPIRTTPTPALGRIRLAWAELGADTEIDSTLAERFESATERRAKRLPNASWSARPSRFAPKPPRASRRSAPRRAADRRARRRGAEDRIAELKVRWDALPPIRRSTRLR
jgi:hypothetical protein